MTPSNFDNLNISVYFIVINDSNYTILNRFYQIRSIDQNKSKKTQASNQPKIRWFFENSTRMRIFQAQTATQPRWTFTLSDPRTHARLAKESEREKQYKGELPKNNPRDIIFSLSAVLHTVPGKYKNEIFTENLRNRIVTDRLITSFSSAGYKYFTSTIARRPVVAIS